MPDRRLLHNARPEAGAGRTIVVGVDGSAESRAAIEWVAAEARAGVDAVHVVHAAAMRAGRTLVDSAVLALRRANPGLAVEGSRGDSSKPVLP
jgi:nucleotide-binding universal stress UspA family protein